MCEGVSRWDGCSALAKENSFNEGRSVLLIDLDKPWVIEGCIVVDDGDKLLLIFEVEIDVWVGLSQLMADVLVGGIDVVVLLLLRWDVVQLAIRPSPEISSSRSSKTSSSASSWDGNSLNPGYFLIIVSRCWRIWSGVSSTKSCWTWSNEYRSHPRDTLNFAYSILFLNSCENLVRGGRWFFFYRKAIKWVKRFLLPD